jgi:hypothetical protein
MSDPTGTAGLRRSFLAEGNRRLGKLRSATHTMLVEHDLMAARSDPFATLLPHPGHRLSAFAQWFERTASEQIAGSLWWQKYLERAYQSGLVAGNELVKNGGAPPSRSSLPAVYRELASREFAGIAAAVVQQVSRQAAGAAIGRRKPLPMYQQVLMVLRSVGANRLKAAVNTITVQLHNAARLEQFRSAGITQVGIVPELIEPLKRSRFLKHDHMLHDLEGPGSRASREETPSGSTIGRITAAYQKLSELESVNVLTAGDERVCIICQDISDGGPYPIDTALGLIPAHPNCRCAFIPADDMRFAINRELATAE